MGCNKKLISWRWSVQVVLVSVVLLSHQTLAASSHNRRELINNEEDVRRIITQFYNYVDAITGIKLDKMLKFTQDFVQQLLDSIPQDDHGNTADMLKDYIIASENLRQHGGSIQQKEQLLMELQQLIATIKSGLAKEEREDIILRRGLLGMFELLARLSIEERKFSDKFSKAATLLRIRLSPESIDNHRDFFDLLEAILQEQDIVLRERLFARLKEIRPYHTMN